MSGGVNMQMKKTSLTFPPRHRTYSCIDMFLTDKWLLQKVSSSCIHKITWSDHAVVSITIIEQGHTVKPHLAMQC